MQTLYVPKYNLHYRVNPKDPCELQWSRKPFGPMTQWQHAMSFKKPIRALDLDDKTKQGVVVLNDSSTYVGSGVRTWGRKFYPAGTRIYSLYAIGESKMKIKVHETQEFHKVVASGLNYDDACFVQEEMQEFANNNGYAAKVRVHNDGSDNFSIVIKSTDESDLTRLPDDFGLDSVIAELQEPSVNKEMDKRDLSHTFSDNYIDREVNFIKGRPWDINASNRFCDKLNAYIASIDEDDNGNDILYIKNDEDEFEITVTIEYGIDNDADQVVDAEWKRT